MTLGGSDFLWGQDTVISVLALTHQDTALLSTSPVVCFQTARAIYSYPSLFDRTQGPLHHSPQQQCQNPVLNHSYTAFGGGGVFAFVVLFFVIFPKRHLGHEST